MKFIISEKDREREKQRVVHGGGLCPLKGGRRIGTGS